jgi:predicted nucleic acid-binding protein
LKNHNGKFGKVDCFTRSRDRRLAHSETVRFALLQSVALRQPRLLSVLEALPFEPPADAIYASPRAGLEEAGTPLGANDMLIAAHALALGSTIVTDNEKGFARVRDLARENWLR